MQAASYLLGNPQNNDSENPMVWFAYSFIYENAGDIDKALEYSEKSRSIIDAGYDAPDFIIGEIYNNYARIAIIKGNRHEALHYLNLAWEKVKITKDMRTIHIVASNRIAQMAMTGSSREECEKALSEYYELIPNDSFMNKIEYNNCYILYSRQIRDANLESRLIKNGFKEIVNHLSPEQSIMFTASTFRMLINGYFDYNWLDEYIHTSLEEYMKLPLISRLIVFKEYMAFYLQEEFRSLYNKKPYAELHKQIMLYYRQNAIPEIDEEIRKLNSYNLYKYMFLMSNKLSILKLIEGTEHIEKSKVLYYDLYRHLYDAGLHIDAINILMTLIDECTSAYNVKVRAPYLPREMYYSELIEDATNIPNPVIAPDGIHVIYPRMVFPGPFEIKPLHDSVIKEYIDIVIDEFNQWKNHPFKIDLSIEIMHLLMCLGRTDEAEDFYHFFLNSGVSEMQMASWAREDLLEMKKFIESSK